jgi:hypothetical protein
MAPSTHGIHHVTAIAGDARRRQRAQPQGLLVGLAALGGGGLLIGLLGHRGSPPHTGAGSIATHDGRSSI